MARLPSAADLGVVPAESGGGPVRIEGGQVGEAVSRLGQAAVSLGGTIVDVHDMEASANAEGDLWRTKVALDQKYRDDPDPGTAPQRYEDEFNAAADAAASNIVSPRYKSQFQGQVARRLMVYSLEGIQNRSEAKLRDQGQASLLQSGQSNIDAAVASGDPTQIDAASQINARAIHAGVLAGYISATDGVELARKWDTELHKQLNANVARNFVHSYLGEAAQGGGQPASRVTVEPLGPPGAQTASLDNNVGNIRASGAAFDGKGAPQNGFETFASPQAGVAALVTNLKSYGDISLRDAIYKWAPPSENDSAAYLASVVKQTGLDPDMPAPTGDVGKMANLAKAMTGVEKGGVKFDDAVFRQGAEAAIKGTPALGYSPTPVQPAKISPGGPTVPPAFANWPNQADAEQEVMAKFADDPAAQDAALAEVARMYHYRDTALKQMDANFKTTVASIQQQMLAHAKDPTKAPDVDMSQVAGMPAFQNQPEAVRALFAFQKSVDGGGSASAVNAKNVEDDFAKVVGGNWTQHDIDQGFAAGRYSIDGYKFLSQKMAGGTADPGEKRLQQNVNKMLKLVLPQIEYPQFMPAGGELDVQREAAYRFHQDLDQAIADAKKAGKNPLDLLDYRSKDYFAAPGNLRRYVKSYSDYQAEDIARQDAGQVEAWKAVMGPGHTGAAQPAASSASGLPADLPTGSVYAGRTKDGRTAYRLPDGSLVAE